jgi:hypothetical protein
MAEPGMMVGATTAAPAAETADFKNRRREYCVVFFGMVVVLVVMLASVAMVGLRN